MEFAQAVKKVENLSLTENGALALKSTESDLLNLFATVGALRDKSYEEVSNLFEKALKEDLLLGIKLMFYARNIRGGLGERKTFKSMLIHLANTNPDVVIKNLGSIPFFGRWDDLYSLENTPCESAMWDMMRLQIHQDRLDVIVGLPISLLSKWANSINTSSKESNRLGKKTATMLGMEERHYRKILSELRSYIKLTESNMSSNQWKEIEYSQVPSRAMKNYRKAFGKHDPEGFGEFISKVEKGEAKINSGTLYPYDILMSAKLSAYRTIGNFTSHGYFNIDTDPVLEAQWKALPDYIEGENNILVMADTSSSMEGLPMATSIGLGVYFAERNKGAYQNLMMTFSDVPCFITLKGKTLKDKVACVPSIVANTNLERAFELILNVAVGNKVSQEEMPKALIIVSDMQIDSATMGHRYETFNETMKRKFNEAGYTIPMVVYWNVEERTSGTHQATKDENGVLLVSGHSTSTFKNLLSSISHTPYELMVEVLSDPIYDCVKI